MKIENLMIKSQRKKKTTLKNILTRHTFMKNVYFYKMKIKQSAF